MAAQIFSTNDIRDGGTFDYWRELARTQILGIELELDRTKRAGFEGYYCLNDAPGASLMATRSGPVEVNRTRNRISMMPADSVMIYQQRRGSAWFGPHRREGFAVISGGFAVGDLDVPFLTGTKDDVPHDFRAVTLSLAFFEGVANRPVSKVLSRVAPADGMHTLFATYFDMFCTQFNELAGGPNLEVASRVLAQLVAVANGEADANEEMSQLGIREARLELARRHVRQNFTDPGLAPAKTAKALHISTRQLHSLFEPTGVSFARFVMTLRLERARERLRYDQRTVTLVALACGFESISTFNRSFRATFGETPTEYRQRIR